MVLGLFRPSQFVFLSSYVYCILQSRIAQPKHTMEATPTARAVPSTRLNLLTRPTRLAGLARRSLSAVHSTQSQRLRAKSVGIETSSRKLQQQKRNKMTEAAVAALPRSFPSVVLVSAARLPVVVQCEDIFPAITSSTYLHYYANKTDQTRKPLTRTSIYSFTPFLFDFLAV
jgi:hypothetical protein